MLKDVTDSHDLEQLGYRPRLRRSLTFFAVWGAAFGFLSPSTGIFSLFKDGFGAIGHWLFWSWPLVAVGQLFVALLFAEQAGRYPVAGSLFQWTKYSAPRLVAWMTGWLYFFGGILTLTAVATTFPEAICPALSLPATAEVKCVLAASVVLTSVIVNVYGVRLMAVINVVGVICEILGLLGLAILLGVSHVRLHGSILHDFTPAPMPGGAAWMSGLMMSLFTLYGFDTASTLAEETHEPRRHAPRAVIVALVSAVLVGAIFIATLLLVAGHVGGPPAPAELIAAALSPREAQIYLMVVSVAIAVCALTVTASTSRLCFAMARDGWLRGFSRLEATSAGNQTPTAAIWIIGLLAALPLLHFASATVIAVGATGLCYAAYLVGVVAMSWRRIRQPPPPSRFFSLGRLGTLTSVAAVLFLGCMTVNLFWRWPNSNPTPREQRISFHWRVIDDMPILWTLAAAVILLGLVFWFAFQRKPEGEAHDHH